MLRVRKPTSDAESGIVSHQEGIPMTHLRKMMLEELERRNYSGTTKECYIRAVEEFARYFNRGPEKLGPEHIRQFQAHR